MSLRLLCLSGVLAAFAATSALAADYGTHQPSSAAGQYLPRRHADRLPFQLKVMWRREEHAKLKAMPREQRRGWLRAAWSHMSEKQKQAKYAELEAKWNALPANVRQALLEKKRQKREARRMHIQNPRGTGGEMNRSAGQTPH